MGKIFDSPPPLSYLSSVATSKEQRDYKGKDKAMQARIKDFCALSGARARILILSYESYRIHAVSFFFYLVEKTD